MKTVCVSLDSEELRSATDEATDSRLLPDFLRQTDNRQRLHVYKKALRWAVDNVLTSLQREHVLAHYWEGKRKSEIAAEYGVNCSTITKSIKSAEEIMRLHVERYASMYDDIRRELEEEWG